MVLKEGCIHHWDIEVAVGSKSKGTCRYCSQTRNFNNSILAKSSFTHINVPRTIVEEEEGPRVSVSIAERSKGNVED